MKHLFFLFAAFCCFTVHAKDFNVKAYGATGNGITDDTQAFDAAMDAVCQNSGTLKVPPGNYILNGSSRTRRGVNGMSYVFLIKGDVSVFIDPQATLIYKKGFKGFRFRTVTDPNDQTVNRYNVKIVGGTVQAIDNAIPVKGNPEIYAFVGETLKRFSVSALAVKNMNASAGVAAYNSDYAEVLNCKFINVVGNKNDFIDNHGVGVYFNAVKSYLIKSNVITNNIAQSGRIGTVGACIEDGKSKSGSIIGNTVTGYDRGIHVELITGTASILNNTIKGCASGIVLWNNNGYPQIIKGNRISNTGLNKNTRVMLYTNACILMLGYNTNNGTVIEDNTIVIDNTSKVEFVPQAILANTSSNVRIINNNIVDKTSSIDIALAQGAGTTKFVENIEVSGNTFSCNKLVISDAADVQVVKNDCTVNNVLFLFNAAKNVGKSSNSNKTTIVQNTIKPHSGKVGIEIYGDYKFDKAQNKLNGVVDLKEK